MLQTVRTYTPCLNSSTHPSRYSQSIEPVAHTWPASPRVPERVWLLRFFKALGFGYPNVGLGSDIRVYMAI